MIAAAILNQNRIGSCGVDNSTCRIRFRPVKNAGVANSRKNAIGNNKQSHEPCNVLYKT